METLRTPSLRPELVVNDQGGRIGENGTQVGFDAPPGLERVVFTLPLINGPTQVDGGEVLHASDIGYVGDAAQPPNMIGQSGPVWIDRLLTATVEWNTRRL
jgi:hypothetical protein